MGSVGPKHTKTRGSHSLSRYIRTIIDTHKNKVESSNSQSPTGRPPTIRKRSMSCEADVSESQNVSLNTKVTNSKKHERFDRKVSGDQPSHSYDRSENVQTKSKVKWKTTTATEFPNKSDSNPTIRQNSTKTNDCESITVSKATASDGTTSTSEFTQQTCPICKRVYGSASIGIHIRACEAVFELRSRQHAAKLAWDNKINRRPSHPPGTICYICGRRYTHNSMSIHLKQCQKQWALWNSLLPRDKRRKTLPVSPEPTEEEIQKRVDDAHQKGLSYYLREDALDEIMLEASEKNRLPLELIC